MVIGNIQASTDPIRSKSSRSAIMFVLYYFAVAWCCNDNMIWNCWDDAISSLGELRSSFLVV